MIDERAIEECNIQKIIEPLWKGVNIDRGERQYYDSVAEFNTEQCFVYAVQLYKSEVSKGGHGQFYFNSTGIVWEEALMGLGELGLKHYHAILKESAKRLGGYPPKDREERWKRMACTRANFNDLNRIFYESIGKGDLEKAMFRYIRANRERFYFTGLNRAVAGTL